MIDKIYVHVIDGTDVWIPINARQVRDNQYELLPDIEYDDLDQSELFQFFPGDIVALGPQTFSDGPVGQVAKELIHRAPIDDRDYWEFQFYATCGELPLDKTTAEKYRQIIERIKKELSAEQFFYQGVHDAITILSELLTDSKK